MWRESIWHTSCPTLRWASRTCTAASQSFYLLEWTRLMFTEIVLHSDPIQCTTMFMLPVYWIYPPRLPIPSHGLCTCWPNILNARKYFSKKCPHQYQQTGRLLLRRWRECRIYGLLSRNRWGEVTAQHKQPVNILQTHKHTCTSGGKHNCPVFLYIWCRMFPVVPMNGRVLADKDVMIGGYQFSKNVSLIYPFLSSLNFWIGTTIF